MSTPLDNLESSVQAYYGLLTNFEKELKSPVERLEPSYKQADLRALFTQICSLENAIKPLEKTAEKNMQASMRDLPLLSRWIKLQELVNKTKKLVETLQAQQKALATNVGPNTFKPMGLCARMWHWVTTPARMPQKAYYETKYALQDLASSATATATAAINTLRWQTIKMGVISFAFGQLSGSNKYRIIGTALAIGALALPKIGSLATKALCCCKTRPVQTTH